MKTFIFSTFDRAAQAYMQPFFAPHSGVAIRGFTDAIKNKSQPSDISNHPDDFDLFELGEWDNTSTKFSLYPEPKLLLQGKQVMLEPELPLTNT